MCTHISFMCIWATRKCVVKQFRKLLLRPVRKSMREPALTSFVCRSKHRQFKIKVAIFLKALVKAGHLSRVSFVQNVLQTLRKHKWKRYVHQVQLHQNICTASMLSMKRECNTNQEFWKIYVLQKVLTSCEVQLASCAAASDDIDRLIKTCKSGAPTSNRFRNTNALLILCDGNYIIMQLQILFEGNGMLIKFSFLW